MRTVPGENPPLCGGCVLTRCGAAPAAEPLGSKVGVSGMEMARPQEEHERAFAEHNAPQPEQVTMRTDCIPPRREVAKTYWRDLPSQIGPYFEDSATTIKASRALFTCQYGETQQ